MSDITIEISQDPSTIINVGPVEETLINGVTLNQGLINHSVTHISGGSDELFHNSLRVQGGQSGQYYHLTQNEYSNNLYKYDLPVYQTGNQEISGNKSFSNRPYINGTGVLLSGEFANTGYLVGYVPRIETGQFYAASNPSGFITGVDFSPYATIGYVTGTSGSLQIQINNLNGSTGSYVLDSETGNFITLSQTGLFYASNNPSGFITGVDLSNYSTISYSTGISGDLQNQISNLNNATGDYVLQSETGQFLVTGAADNRYVSLNGNQTIYDTKSFSNDVYINRLFVTGTETIANTTVSNIQSPYILLNLTGGAFDGGIFFVTGDGLTGINDSGAIIGFDHSDKFKFGISTRASDLSSLNTIASEQQVTGLSGYLQNQIASTGSTLNIKIDNLSGYINSSESNIVYTTGNQNITGVKTFKTGIFVEGDVSAFNMYSNSNRVAVVVDPVRTSLTGNGAISTFNISGASGIVNPSALIVAIDGAMQEPSIDYFVSGSQITFTSPLASGSKAVVISPTNTLQVSQMIPADGSVSSSKLDTNIQIAGQLTAPNQIASIDSSLITRNLLGLNSFLVRDIFSLAGRLGVGVDATARRSPTNGIVDGDVGPAAVLNSAFYITHISGSLEGSFDLNKSISLNRRWVFFNTFRFTWNTNTHTYMAINAGNALTGIPTTGNSVGFEIISNTQIRLWKCINGVVAYSATGAINAPIGSGANLIMHNVWLECTGADTLNLYLSEYPIGTAPTLMPATPICTISGLPTGTSSNGLITVVRATGTPSARTGLGLVSSKFIDYPI